MLVICNKFHDLDLRQLFSIYDGSIKKSMEINHKEQSIIEEQLRSYLRDVFFLDRTAFYALWLKAGEYVSVVRAEAYADGYLLTGLETKLEFRRQGFADNLLKKVLMCLKERGNPVVYAHVHKQNKPSLALHEKHGFTKLLDYGKLIDGTVSDRFYTLVWK